MTDKVKKSEQKLVRAFGNVTDTIVDGAKKLKTEDADPKKLKELTTIAKELYAIVKDTGEDAKGESDGIDVIFVGDDGAWAE